MADAQAGYSALGHPGCAILCGLSPGRDGPAALQVLPSHPFFFRPPHGATASPGRPFDGHLRPPVRELLGDRALRGSVPLYYKVCIGNDPPMGGGATFTLRSAELFLPGKFKSRWEEWREEWCLVPVAEALDFLAEPTALISGGEERSQADS